jgi:hypothetical protein
MPDDFTRQAESAATQWVKYLTENSNLNKIANIIPQ